MKYIFLFLLAIIVLMCAPYRQWDTGMHRQCTFRDYDSLVVNGKVVYYVYKCIHPDCNNTDTFPKVTRYKN